MYVVILSRPVLLIVASYNMVGCLNCSEYFDGCTQHRCWPPSQDCLCGCRKRRKAERKATPLPWSKVTIGNKNATSQLARYICLSNLSSGFLFSGGLQGRRKQI